MAILATQKVLTLDYWKMASDITESDILFNLHGKPVKVKLVQQYRADECYEVVFNDGLTIAGDVHLTLPTENHKHRTRSSIYKGRHPFRRPLKQLPISELLSQPIEKLSVPTVKPLQLPTQTLPVEPFVFGFWFTNANLHEVMTTNTETQDYVFKKFKDAGYKVLPKHSPRNNRQKFTTVPTIRSHLIPTVPTKIPNNYLLASATQRLELLRGIMNAWPNAYKPKRDNFVISKPNSAFLTSVQLLAESLGCRTNMSYSLSNKHYFLTIKTRLQLTPTQTSPRLKVFQNRRYIKKITPLPSQLCVHIETDSGFVAQEGFIACH